MRVAPCGSLAELRLLRSRSHPSSLVDRMAHALGVTRSEPRGGAGVKIMLVAEGEADLCLMPGRKTRVWDVCAPEAILTAAGGKMTDFGGAPLWYRGPSVVNRRGVVASGGSLHDGILQVVGPIRQERYGST
jgi:3'(2'), 5'-bisphosphate nucleotidase